MATKTLNARVQLKFDTKEKWEQANPILLKGEVAIINDVDNSMVLIKVGNGTDNFNTLPFLSAKAADVSAWAKAATKPEYTASEIQGLSDYISGKVQDTNTTYKLEYADNKLTLSKKDLGEADWTVANEFTLEEYDDTALAARVTATETAITTLNGTEAGSVKKTVADAINDFATKISDDGTINTFKELVDYAAQNASDLGDLINQVNTNETALNNLKTLVGTLPEGVTATTVVGYIAEAVAASEAKLATIATTGNVNDLVQTTGDYLILNCGSASVNI